MKKESRSRILLEGNTLESPRAVLWFGDGFFLCFIRELSGKDFFTKMRLEMKSENKHNYEGGKEEPLGRQICLYKGPGIRRELDVFMEYKRLYARNLRVRTDK